MSPEFSASENEESNLMIQQACENSSMICRCASLASLAMGSAIWLKDVYIGLSQLTFKKMLYLHETCFAQVSGYQHTEAVGSLENWDLILPTDCQHKIRVSLLYQLSFYCGAVLAKSLDGNRFEAQRIWSCM